MQLAVDREGIVVQRLLRGVAAFQMKRGKALSGNLSHRAFDHGIEVGRDHDLDGPMPNSPSKIL
ncbi:hypothetical protein NLM33_37280 [Bradyrhizobium sp. CCGUVB1N3]|uniref:hypothetical protein n=1 Tax=Bradyrhizobium sp. CCGUVB1N3 TaxID=2949629 RepID=UPI0020B27BBA|nr:hypothetical protein [Bradyrhizobium sp. CCGUVB1N3]MCP3475897.1 hypothetical protein [Bradyrhizobium sp. CCGUVB1N3]